jgi:hypothetical protein
MSKRSNWIRYVESLVTFIYDNTKGLEAELNALFQALRVRKVKWVGKPIGVKKEGKRR